jgi:glucose-1-phosphate cytidylyltransferase
MPLECNYYNKRAFQLGVTVQVVILAGGRGTRAYPYTEYLPKPMMPVGGKPILARVMEIFAQQGHVDFVISVGYRKEIIVDYFEHRRNDWNVTIVDTGDETDTGSRIKNCRHVLEDKFFATYSDGICDVNLANLQAFHQAHDGLVTVTSVPLVSQYGTIESDEAGRILAFREKPVLRDYWINAGFFLMDTDVFDHWEGENLERDVMPGLQRERLLYTYRHNGFFKSMDTHKDQQELEQIYERGKLPWLLPAVA